MNVLDEYLDILQNIEAAVIGYWGTNPSIKDAQVQAVYEKLFSNYDRRKRSLPELPAHFQPLTMSLYEEVKAVCESRVIGSPDELPDLENVTPGVMVLCLKKLLDSVKFWSKQNGARGYLQYVGEMLG